MSASFQISTMDNGFPGIFVEVMLNKPGDIPHTFGKRLLNLLGAGVFDRKAAARMRDRALTAIDQIRKKQEKIEHEVLLNLKDFWDYKTKVYEEKIEKIAEFSNTHTLIGKSERIPFQIQDESPNIIRAPKAPDYVKISYPIARTLAGFLLGCIAGGVIGYGIFAISKLQRSEFTLLIIFALLCITLGAFTALLISTKHYASARVAERLFLIQTGCYIINAFQRVIYLHKFQPIILKMQAVIEKEGEDLLSAITHNFEPTLEDGTNACSLLTSILDIPLFNADGAFLSEAIEKLHMEKQKIERMKLEDL
jgi:hypothetical protein